MYANQSSTRTLNHPPAQPDSSAALQRLIDGKHLTPLFQPIVALDGGRIIGYEALIRGPEGSHLHSPAQLFDAARNTHQLAALEYACREASCEAFVRQSLPGKLFLNMSPLSFTDRHYREGVTREILARVGLAPERVVFELTERQPLDEFVSLRAATDHFRHQGFLLLRPCTHPPGQLEGLDRLVGFRPRSHDTFTFRQKVGDIAQHAEPVEPTVTTLSVVERFRADLQLTCLPVVDGDRPLGMVSRSELLNVFSHRYSYELHASKPIARFICKRTIRVDVECELNVAGQLVTEDPLQNLSVDLLVEREGHYVGVVRVGRLLRCITEEKMRLARHSNPLTELPGNVPLYEWIDQLLLDARPFTVAYCDINQFKPFNDAFGYGLGDDVILMLARILMQQADKHQDFIGHVGGDDFVVVFRSDDWRNRCHRILAQFGDDASALMPPGQSDYWSQDRLGRRQRFGPLTLSIGCVSPDPESCKTHHQVAQLLAEAKHSAKALGGNSLFESRRRNPT